MPGGHSPDCLPGAQSRIDNMSAPPHTVVEYSGLADLRAASEAPSGRATNSVFGEAVRVSLPHDLLARLRRASVRGTAEMAATVLRELDVEETTDPERRVAELIEARAQALPLPDGCLVVADDTGQSWASQDVLTVLAVLTKCSDSVWLRDKTPSLHAALDRGAASLLVPPRCAGRLHGASSFAPVTFDSPAPAPRREARRSRQRGRKR